MSPKRRYPGGMVGKVPRFNATNRAYVERMNALNQQLPKLEGAQSLMWKDEGDAGPVWLSRQTDYLALFHDGEFSTKSEEWLSRFEAEQIARARGLLFFEV